MSRAERPFYVWCAPNLFSIVLAPETVENNHVAPPRSDELSFQILPPPRPSFAPSDDSYEQSVSQLDSYAQSQLSNVMGSPPHLPWDPRHVAGLARLSSMATRASVTRPFDSVPKVDVLAAVVEIGASRTKSGLAKAELRLQDQTGASVVLVLSVPCRPMKLACVLTDEINRWAETSIAWSAAVKVGDVVHIQGE